MEQQHSGTVEYNFHPIDTRPAPQSSEQSRRLAEIAACVGTDWATFRREATGVSVFVLNDGIVRHTYSASARGLDGLWGMY